MKGSLEEEKFIMYYVDDKDRVIAAAGMGSNHDMMTLLEAMEQNALPKASMIKSGRFTPGSIKLSLKKNNVGGGRCKRANCCQNKKVE